MRDLHLRVPQGVSLLGGPSVTPETLLMAVLLGIAVVTALLALLAREVVHTIIWIGGFFVTLSAIYFVLYAAFLGVLQLAVYAGAVTILLLFAVMVIKKRIFVREAGAGVGPVPILLALALGAVLVALAVGVPGGTTYSAYDVTALSANLFTRNGAWLLLLGLVMLSALAGSIHLAREMRGAPSPPRGGVP